MKYFNLLPVALLAMLYGCEKNDEPSNTEGAYSKGVYIVNEGSFNSNNGSISFYDPDSNFIINNIFELVNDRPLGDVVQSFSVVGDSLGFIVVNNSSKVEIVRLSTFETKSDPIPVVYPRYFLQVNSNKGYLSAGSLQGYLFVIDFDSFSIIDSISVGFGPETMILEDDLLYVANSGGWGNDSTISVINSITDEVEDIIMVEQVPVDMAIDAGGNLWVYCKGYTNYAEIETESYLQKVNPRTKEILWQSKVGMALDYASVPAKCAVSKDGRIIYYLRPDGVYSVPVSLPALSEEPLIEGNFYGLEINPDDGNIYVFESSFSGNGSMKIYSSNGVLLSEGVVGIGPNGAVFNL
jgi:hypothetical protein